MDAYTAVVTKKDLRAYTNEPVGEEPLRRVLQAGRMAGSAKATEPCRFVVVTDADTKTRLAATGAFAGWIDTAPAVVAVVLQEGANPFDAGRAAQNMMIVAHAEGLGTCPVTVGDGALEVLGVPAGHRVAIVIALGHPTADSDKMARLMRRRQPLDEYVHRDGWRQ